MGYGRTHKVFDANEAIEPNKFYVIENGVNAPTSDGLFYILWCSPSSGSDLMQFSTPINYAVTLYLRYCRNNSWGPWSEIALNGNLPKSRVIEASFPSGATTRNVIELYLQLGEQTLISYSILRIDSGKRVNVQALQYYSSNQHLSIVYDKEETSDSVNVVISLIFS